MDEPDSKTLEINVPDSPELTRSTDSIPLKVLLSFPYFWKSCKIFMFLRDSWNCIKDQNRDAEVEFKKMLDNASKYVLPIGHTEWKSVLGDKHWDILRREGSRPLKKSRMRNASGSSLYQLLRLIRNKAEHPETPGEVEKIALGWFPDGDFDDHEFVVYWLDKFPKLLPFIWLKFWPFHRQAVDRHYSVSLEDHYETLCLNWEMETLPDDFLKQFYKAIDNHLEEGGLLKRYTLTSISSPQQQPTVLEFRTLDSRTVDSLLDGNSSPLTVEMKQGKLYFKWSSFSSRTMTCKERVMEYDFRSDPNVLSPEDNSMTIIVGNIIKDENLAESCSSKRLIFFVNEDTVDIAGIESAAKKFANLHKSHLSEQPLHWLEICESRRFALEEEGEVSVQGKVVKLRTILPERSRFSNLKGDILSQLLVNRKPILFDKHKIPKIPQPYLSRHLYRFCCVCSKVLRHRSPDLIVVTNIGVEELRGFMNPSEKLAFFQAEGVTDKLEMNCRIFLLEDCEHHYDNALAAIKYQLRKDDDRSIHCIQYLGDNTFQWLGTYGYGSLSLIKRSLKTKDSDLVQFEEPEFLANVEDDKCEPIFIAEKPGMGKSALLISLANQIAEKFENSFVVMKSMNEFIISVDSILRKNNQTRCGKNDIVATIQNIISNSEFENDLVDCWLKGHENFSIKHIRLELMLDGLDEVEKKYRDLAMSVLKIIRHELPSIRLWVTLREYMEDEIEKHFNAICYKIQPFSEDDQVRYLQQYWLSKIEIPSETKLEAIQNFAKKCIRLANIGVDTAEIAGAPLQCRMLGEVYENSLHNLQLASNDSFFSLTELYGNMIHNRINEFLRVKKGVRNPDDDYLDSFRKDTHKWHMYQAIKLLFDDWLTDNFVEYLNVTKKSTATMETTVKEQGIIVNLDPLRFLHRTVAEYFVALFISKVLKGDFEKMSDNDMAAFQEFLCFQVFGVSKHHQTINDCISLTVRNSAKFKFPVLCYFLNAMLNASDPWCTNLTNFLVTLHDLDSNLTSFDCDKSVILATLQHNYFNLAQLLLLSSNDRRIFLDKTKDLHEFLLQVAIRYSTVDFFKYICSLIEDWHKNKGTTYTISLLLFKLALDKGKLEIVKFLVENKGFSPETWESIHTNDKKGFGIIHHIIRKSRNDKDEVIEEKKRLLEFIVETDPSAIEHKDAEGRTPILLPFSASFQLKAFLITKLGAKVNVTGKYRNTAFHWKCYSDYEKAISPDQYHEMLETFMANGFKEINLISNTRCTPLHCAIKTYYDTLKEETLQLLENAGADFNAKDNNGKTVLHLCIQKNCATTFIETLITCGADIFEINSNGQTALQLAREKDNSSLEKILIEKFHANVGADNEE